MISICLKSNNISSLNLIETYLDNISLPEIYYSQNKFKHFNNIIIHYKGSHKKQFFSCFSNMLSQYIINFYEKSFIRQQLSFDYFYFSYKDKKIILNSVIDKMHTESNISRKKNILNTCIINYFLENNSCNLDGFINFRLYNYKEFINLIIENVINDYVIQKEYDEYVNLLHEYITLQTPQSENIHLIYSDTTKILLDDSKNIIANTCDSQIYLSDISFSSNDFILNSLLNLLPKKIFIHLGTIEDNFIKFIKLVFKDRYILCNNCTVCSQYFSNSISN